MQHPELGGKGARKSQQTDEEFTRGAGLTSARLGCKRFSEADSYPGGQTNKAREAEAQGLRVGWGPEPPRLTTRHRHQDGPGRPAPSPGPAGCDGKPPPPASAAGPEEAASDTAHVRPPKTSSVKHLRQASPSPWKPPAFAVGSRDRRTGQGRAGPAGPACSRNGARVARAAARSLSSQLPGDPPPAVRVALLATSPEH